MSMQFILVKERVRGAWSGFITKGHGLFGKHTHQQVQVSSPSTTGQRYALATECTWKSQGTFYVGTLKLRPSTEAMAYQWLNFDSLHSLSTAKHTNYTWVVGMPTSIVSLSQEHSLSQNLCKKFIHKVVFFRGVVGFFKTTPSTFQLLLQCICTCNCIEIRA